MRNNNIALYLHILYHDTMHSKYYHTCTMDFCVGTSVYHKHIYGDQRLYIYMYNLSIIASIMIYELWSFTALLRLPLPGQLNRLTRKHSYSFLMRLDWIDNNLVLLGTITVALAYLEVSYVLSTS